MRCDIKTIINNNQQYLCKIVENSMPDVDKPVSKFKECIGCDISKDFNPYQGDALPLINSKPINIHQAYDGMIYHH